jgi:hypothetical protein
MGSRLSGSRARVQLSVFLFPISLSVSCLVVVRYLTLGEYSSWQASISNPYPTSSPNLPIYPSTYLPTRLPRRAYLGFPQYPTGSSRNECKCRIADRTLFIERALRLRWTLKLKIAPGRRLVADFRPSPWKSTLGYHFLVGVVYSRPPLASQTFRSSLGLTDA